MNICKTDFLIEVLFCPFLSIRTIRTLNQGILKGGKYHCTVDLLFVWLGISCMTTDNFCFYLLNRLIQTSQTGGQWYSDTSPFSIPCLNLWFTSSVFYHCAVTTGYKAMVHIYESFFNMLLQKFL